MFRIIGVPIPKVKQENEKLCVKFWLYGITCVIHHDVV